MNIGIICEYNPFHYGHLLHLNEIKKMYPNSNIILVLSGWITERGDLSLIDKFKKTQIALNYGVDLVVELPFKYIQSADYFAMGAIKILNELKCDTIVFGSESNNVDELINLARIQLNNKEYDLLVKKYLEEGINYPTAMSKALKTISGKTVDTPNDILGLCYVKEIIKNNYTIKPVTIKRNSNFNSKTIEGKITSATSIRELIKNNKRFKKYVPSYSYKNLKDCLFIDDYFDYLKYKIISSNNLTIYQGVDENVENRIRKFINDSNSLENLLSKIKTKRYTYNRLKRILTFILFSITKEDCNNLELEYIRVLGFDKKGKDLLNKIKKDINIPILTNYDDKYLNKDLNINTIISLNKKIKDKRSFIEKEYKEKPIIK
ncbi:MAG: nucleotidyltransferase [Bacilli bacterium]|nr:nucleotidyltransferase [Bacilli bacterium]